MSFQDHLKTCSYCSKNNTQSRKPTVRIKAASSYNKQKKLSQLGAIIKGTSYAGWDTSVQTKGASSSSSSSSFANYSKVNGPLALEKEKKFKLKELGKMIRGL